MEPRKLKAMRANSSSDHAPEEEQEQPQAKPKPAIRFASKEQFEKAQRKTTTLHAGLFRRLAK